jgi:hypothetical protein
VKLSLFTFSCWLLAPAAFAILDTNNNGVSDFWEREFNNGNLFDEFFDPQADYDSDGWTNEQEAAAGTNPFDPNPPDGMIRPDIAHIPAVYIYPEEEGEPDPPSPDPEEEPDPFDPNPSPPAPGASPLELLTPAAVTVSWPTLAGKQYMLFYSPDLTQGSWLPVGSPFIANGGEVTYGFEISEEDKCFWRVAVQDVDSDNDGLTNYEEILAGTNPYSADSDGDGLTDKEEAESGTDPNKADTDDDELGDAEDADPNDGEINWEKTPEVRYVWVEQVVAAANHGAPIALNKNGLIVFDSFSPGGGYSIGNSLWDSAARTWVVLETAGS